jgi:hypothetical protein
MSPNRVTQALLAATALLLLANFLSHQTTTVFAAKHTPEYRVEIVNRNQMAGTLNELTHEGWTFTQAISVDNGSMEALIVQRELR